MRKLGFYNKLIDDVNLLRDCDVTFDDFNKLKDNLGMNDTILLSSPLSLYGVDDQEFRNLMSTFKLSVKIVDNDMVSSVMSNLMINILLANLEFIKNNDENIKKLLSVSTRREDT